MSVTQYIGARYVPLFAEPLDWDITSEYEPLTIVYYQGNSYTSKQAVPSNIDITNTEYWALTGNYNAQVEAYRSEVQTFDGRIDTNTGNISTNTSGIAQLSANTGVSSTSAIATPLSTQISNEVTARENAISAETTARENAISAETTARENAISAETTARETQIENESSARISADNEIQTEIDIINGKRAILIGDSYGQGWTPDGSVAGWTTIARNKLIELGWTVYTHSLGGSGFSGDNGFLNSLQIVAANRTSQEKLEVSKIVFGGGFNDRSGAVESGIAAVRTYIKNNFPNAEVIIAAFGSCVTGITGGGHETATLAQCYNAYRAYYEYGTKYGFIPVKGAIGWLNSNSYFASDYVHPLTSGNTKIGEKMFGAIMGSLNYVEQNYLESSFTKASNISNTEPSNVTSVYFALDDNGIAKDFVLGPAQLSLTFKFRNAIQLASPLNRIVLGTIHQAAATGMLIEKTCIAMLHYTDTAASNTPRYPTIPLKLSLTPTGDITANFVVSNFDESNYASGPCDEIRIYYQPFTYMS